ncbi:MAG: hypothetical protein WC421_00080 [Elusimicrobiales bacterium]
MEVSDYLLVPPVAFILALAFTWLFSRLASRLAHPKVETEGKNLPYACGENVPLKKPEPEYGAFFPFAIFFTVLHVAGLMIASLSGAQALEAVTAGAVYIMVTAVALAVLFVG